MRKNAVDRKNDLINDLIEARQSLLAAVQSVPTGQVDQPCIGVWGVKELLAHLIGWDETNRMAVQEILAGEQPSFFSRYDTDWRTFNAALVAQHRKDSLKTMISDAELSHVQLMEYLQSLTADEVLKGKSPREKGRPVTIHNLLRAEAEDERKHAEQVRSFLQRCAPQVNV